MPPAIRIKAICKTFHSASNSHGKILALDQVSLDIYPGEIIGVLGPNGAGKTTLINILATLLCPDKGSAEILGLPVIPRHYSFIRTKINMTSGYPNFAWCLSVEENLRFYGRLYGLRGKVLEGRVQELIEMFALEKFARQPFEELSSGTKQRLSLAKAFLNDPEILFLDEPTVGLDPDVAVKIRQMILHILKQKKLTVLLTTHNMDEAELLCERIAFLKEGRLIKLAPLREFKIAEGKRDLEEIFLKLAAGQEPTALKGQGGECYRDIPLGKGTQEMIKEGNPDSTGSENIRLKRSDAAKIRQEESPSSNVLPPGRGLQAWWNRTLAFTFRNWLFARRNIFAFAELVFWPVVSLLSIGLLGNYLHLQEEAFAFILTGAIAAGILQVTQLDVAYNLLYEVWSKSMKHTFLTPVGLSEGLMGSWVIGMVRGGIIFALLGLSAIALFGFPFPSIPETLIFLLGIYCSSLLLGMMVNILILIFGQKAEISAWMFAYLFMLISGIYYPIDTLSSPFFEIAQGIPITYFLEYFRRSFGFEPVLDQLLLKGFGLFFLYLVLGLSLMRWALGQARRKGTLIRLSE